MKRLFILLCGMAMLAGAGCSKSDDNSNPSNGNGGNGGNEDGDTPTITVSQLIGTWEATKLYDGEFGIWFEEYGEQFGYVETLSFRADGTGLFRTEETGSNTWEEAFTYTVENNIITTRPTDGNENTLYRVEKLTDSEMVLAIGYEGENGKPCTDKIYYKRIDSSGSEGGDGNEGEGGDGGDGGGNEGDGDDEGNQPQIDLQYLQGKWEAYQEYLGDTGEIIPYNQNRDILDIGPNIITATIHGYDDNDHLQVMTLEITYTLDGNTLTGEDEDGEVYSFRIEVLTQTEFVYSYESSSPEHGTFRNKTYYRRIG